MEKANFEKDYTKDITDTLSINNPRLKVHSIAILITTIIACCIVITYTTIDENKRLKDTIATLNGVNAHQTSLLAEKALQTSELKKRESLFNTKVKDFTQKLSKLTDNYIASRPASKVSRSGDRTVKSVTSDLTQLKTIISSLKDLEAEDKQNVKSLTSIEQKLQNYLSSVPTLWPASGKISDRYGYRKDPFTRHKTFHEGLDLGAQQGSPIKASADGTVIFSGRKNGYGNTVVISHGNGLSTLYGHASKLLVKTGDKVKKGFVIAKVGSTGRSTGPHLHYEILINGSPVDPLQYLEMH